MISFNHIRLILPITIVRTSLHDPIPDMLWHISKALGCYVSRATTSMTVITVSRIAPAENRLHQLGMEDSFQGPEQEIDQSGDQSFELPCQIQQAQT